jgi:hypothetical protein
MAWASAKPIASGASMPPPGAPGASMPLPAVPTHERRLPSPPRTADAVVGGAEVSMDLFVDDYLVGGVTMFDAHTGQGPADEFFVNSGFLT